MLKHEYFDASDDIAAHLADECGRQAVTVQWFCDNLDPDTPAWSFYKRGYEQGTEKWFPVELMELSETGLKEEGKPSGSRWFYLDWMAERPRPANTRIFVQKTDLIKAGFTPPKSRWEEFKEQQATQQSL